MPILDYDMFGLEIRRSATAKFTIPNWRMPFAELEKQDSAHAVCQIHNA